MFVRRDERGELGSRELVELREETFHRDRAIEATLEHDRATSFRSRARRGQPRDDRPRAPETEGEPRTGEEGTTPPSSRYRRSTPFRPTVSARGLGTCSASGSATCSATGSAADRQPRP